MLLIFIQRNCNPIPFWAVWSKVDTWYFYWVIHFCCRIFSTWLFFLFLLQVSIANEKNIIICLLSYNQFNNLETLLANFKSHFSKWQKYVQYLIHSEKRWLIAHVLCLSQFVSDSLNKHSFVLMHNSSSSFLFHIIKFSIFTGSMFLS